METGLVHLRAILNKKKQEATDDLAERKVVRSNAFLKSQKKEHGDPSFNAKKRLKVKKIKEDSCDPETEQKFAKSKSMLERKAALYDKLKSGTEVLEHDELNEKFLINFQEKIINDVKVKKEEKKEIEVQEDDDKSYRATKEEEEWVEYTDSLGRSRMCQKKDLEAMRELDSNILGFDVKKINSEEEERTREFHEKWRQIEEETNLKDNIHYQDVLFDEARVHGVGYMHFSRDEETRKKQQDLLKELRKETILAGESKKATQKEKDAAMAERIAKIRQRKRLKMGLPAISLEEKKLQNDSTVKEDEPSSSDKVANNPISFDLPLTRVEEKPIHPMREWDIGKYSNSGSVMTQQEWVASRRKDRDTEFAPPTIYDAKNLTTKGDDELRRKKTHTLSHKRTSQIFEKQSQVSFTESHSNAFPSCSNPAKDIFDGTILKGTSVDNVNKEPPTIRGAGPEFAPPSKFEYYGPSSSKRRTLHPFNAEDAIEKGLAYFRKVS